MSNYLTKISKLEQTYAEILDLYHAEKDEVKRLNIKVDKLTAKNVELEGFLNAVGQVNDRLTRLTIVLPEYRKVIERLNEYRMRNGEK